MKQESNSFPVRNTDELTSSILKVWGRWCITEVATGKFNHILEINIPNKILEKIKLNKPKFWCAMSMDQIKYT